MATAAPAVTAAPAPPPVDTGTPDAPVKKIDTNALRMLGQDLRKLFDQFAQDRQLTELKWVRNLRQFLGVYDPDVEKELPSNGSRAYPRITRVKCISMLARIMNLMFPGNEDNWSLTASPSAEIDPADAKQAVEEMKARYAEQGLAEPPITFEFVEQAIQALASKRAEAISRLIKDQLQEIGGDQTLDYISLNRKVLFSGILYGLGVLEGPYVKSEDQVLWGPDGAGGFAPRKRTVRKPLYEFLPVWDYYPDMSAKTLGSGDGYFIRKIMGRADVRKLANRPDFFASEIKKYLKQNTQGNYQAKSFEEDLRTMGTRAQVNEKRSNPHGKYEIIIWKGPVSADQLSKLGVDVPEQYMADDVEAEVWMIDNFVIKADINAWRRMGIDVRTVHTFVFDEDDTSPIGNGLPNIFRDSQMSICAAVRMALDNASVTCGPNVEVNTSLLTPGQDINGIHAYKVWVREDDGVTAQFPAVRELKFDSHLNELQQLVTMFMTFADTESFVGPATGGDMQKQPSEPMRTAAGQSMVRGDAALPFRDVVRNFDFFTQSWILSLVYFNRKFNPGLAKEADYDVVARGATSLIAKEIRGMQVDMLTQTLTPEDRDFIDEEKLMRQRIAVRDMQDIMLSPDEAKRKRETRLAGQSEMSEKQMQKLDADIRKTLAEAFKNITQGQKNSAAADAQSANTALDILEVGMNDVDAEGAQAPDSK